MPANQKPVLSFEMEAALLHCPIRGGLRSRQRAADGLTFTEEKHRIDAIRYLLQRRYPRDNFGVEPTLFKLGRDGRNSFRTDFAIYDVPFDDLRGKTLDRRLEHVRVLAEVKRDNVSAEQAKATQVRSALRLVPDIHTLGVYWDDLEQRFFYRKREGRTDAVHEAPISKIPAWGADVGSTQLSYADLDAAKDLVRIFDEVEDALHPYIVDKAERYLIIQQLLLTKIHDENTHRAGNRTNLPLDFQDFSIEAISDAEVLRRMTAALERAAAHYNLYLPSSKNISGEFMCPPDALRSMSRIIAPVNLLGSKTKVIQAFYMKFAKNIYKWDLAQYFTPHEVIDFIVEMANPQTGEHIHDPACGSADFLISAFRKVGPTQDSCVWGADNSEQAVQISILNMVLNGDGKTQISNVDSLKDYSENRSQKYSVVLCNPPFGTKIVERRFEVLRKFDLGRRWFKDRDGGVVQSEEVRTSQQTGILFAELCVHLCRPGGRVAIILPNGYLENKSIEYAALREWLLCHTRVVGVVAFPRFTFKKSGADVSASVLLLERRIAPLRSASESDPYSFYAGNLESVGWRAGDKAAVPTYLRDEATGDVILDADNEPVVDADFDKVLAEFIGSSSSDLFPWVVEDRVRPSGPQHASIDILEVLTRWDRSLSPKLFSAKFRNLRAAIKSRDHVKLGDVFELEAKNTGKRQPSDIFRYVDIERIGIGEYDVQELRGWQLPDRAKLPAREGDLFIASIWSSVGKWFIAPSNTEKLLVTNGCTRFRPKVNDPQLLASVFVGLCSELFKVQMRALATGSDGLAEISGDDVLDVIFPKLTGDADIQAVMASHERMILGEERFSKMARHLIESHGADFPSPAPRKSHCALI